MLKDNNMDIENVYRNFTIEGQIETNKTETQLCLIKSRFFFEFYRRKFDVLFIVQ